VSKTLISVVIGKLLYVRIYTVLYIVKYVRHHNVAWAQQKRNVTAANANN